MRRVAVITGGNRGLGVEICRQLAEQGNLVILTARDPAKGLAAVESFQKQELPVRFFPLEVTSAVSIQSLINFLEKEFGRCDILVNNAGIFPDKDETSAGMHAPIENVRQAMETNVYGPILLCQGIVPLMQKNNYGRIVNLSSGLGQLGEMAGEFLAYRMSKTALNVVTRVFAAEVKGHNILINSVCPGWCATDMGGPEAPRTPSEGADTVVWLATLPDGGPTGGFFRDRKPILW